METARIRCRPRRTPNHIVMRLAVGSERIRKCAFPARLIGTLFSKM